VGQQILGEVDGGLFLFTSVAMKELLKSDFV